MKTINPFWLTVLVATLVLVGCKGEGTSDSESPTASKSAAENDYEIRGKVMELDKDKSTVKLDHEDIPGLMKAMEMTFNVEDAKSLEGIKAGDTVQGRVKKSEKAETGYLITGLSKRTSK